MNKVIPKVFRKVPTVISACSYSRNVNPYVRTWNVISKDIPVFFGLNKKDIVYPEHTDIVIIGGGFLGAAAAYSLKMRAGEGLSVVVLEKDIIYQGAQKHLQQSTLSQHFSLPENIYLSQYSAEFLRNIKEHLNKDVNIDYCPTGSLVLASEKYAEKLEENVSFQKEYGTRSELLTVEEIKNRFPWLNISDVGLGCLSAESEGTFNSWELLKGLIQKCKELGTTFVNAEVVGFEMEKQRDVLMEGVAPGSFERIIKVIYRTDDNEEYRVKFACCILTAGFSSSEIAKLAKVGTGDGLLSVPLPIDKREHAVYSIEGNPTKTGLNTPIVMDTSGLWLKKNGLNNNLLCGHTPLLSLDTKDLQQDEFYKNIIKPSLLNRVPSCENAEINHYCTETYDCNTFDDSGILGPHPYHNNLYIASGFGKQGCLHAPALGRAIAELIIDSQYTSIDLTRLGFDRMLTGQPLIEFNVY